MNSDENFSQDEMMMQEVAKTKVTKRRKSADSIKFYLLNKSVEDEDVNDNDTISSLFQLAFIKLIKILNSELINEIISIILNEQNDGNDNWSKYDKIYKDYCDKQHGLKKLRKKFKTKEVDEREIKDVLSTNWINKYQFKFRRLESIDSSQTIETVKTSTKLRTSSLPPTIELRDEINLTNLINRCKNEEYLLTADNKSTTSTNTTTTTTTTTTISNNCIDDNERNQKPKNNNNNDEKFKNLKNKIRKNRQKKYILFFKKKSLNSKNTTNKKKGSKVSQYQNNSNSKHLDQDSLSYSDSKLNFNSSSSSVPTSTSDTEEQEQEQELKRKASEDLSVYTTTTDASSITPTNSLYKKRLPEKLKQNTPDIFDDNDTSSNSETFNRLKQVTNLLVYLKSTSLLGNYASNTARIRLNSSSVERNTYIDAKYKECLNDLEKAKLGLISHTNTQSNMLSPSTDKMVNKIIENQSTVDIMNKNMDKKYDELVKEEQEEHEHEQQPPIISPPLNLLTITDALNSCYSNSKNKTENATISSSSSLSIDQQKEIELEIKDIEATSQKLIKFDLSNDNYQNDVININEDYEQYNDNHFLLNNNTNTVRTNLECFDNNNNNNKNLTTSSKLLLSILYSLSEPNITLSNNNDYVYFDAINKILNNQKNVEVVKCLLNNVATTTTTTTANVTTLPQSVGNSNKINMLKKNFDLINSILNKHDYYSSSSSSAAIHSYFRKRIKLISKENLNLSTIDLNDILTNTLTSSTSFNSYESIQLIKKSSSCSNLNTCNNKNFEKFLQNVIKGKKKSQLLFSQHQEQDEEIQALQQSSLTPIAVQLPTTTTETTATVQNAQKQDENKSKLIDNLENIDIPDAIRGALASAGIDISHIINLKNQIEMTINNNNENTSSSNKISDKKNNNEKVEIINKDESKIRTFEIKQDISAKVIHNIENENDVISMAGAERKPSKQHQHHHHDNLRSSTINTIIPAKEISLFKPIVIQKRTVTTPPTMSLNHLIASSSTDSFNDLLTATEESIRNKKQNISSNNNNKNSSSYSIDEEDQSTSKTLNNQNEIISISDIDSSSNMISTSIPTSMSHMENMNFLGASPLKKKPSVTRSFSYNISKLSNQSSKNEKTSDAATKSNNGEKMLDKDENSKESKIATIAANMKSTISSNLKVISTPSSSTNGTNLNKATMRSQQNININQKNFLSTTNTQQSSTTGIVSSVSTSDLPHSTGSLMKFATDDEEANGVDHKYHAKRRAIVMQMYDTEKSYVEALKNLVTKYYLPLKEKDVVERNLINDIFYKIPEIHVHHELLFSALESKLEAWDSRQTVGDLLFNIFAKQSVIETYISFVNNFHTSQEAYRICKDQSSMFNKFIEQQAKDHKGKLTLKDLIIQPVQRIPRYELYIKDFLKCTAITHPDYPYLLKAQKELHNLAEKIDQVHKEVNEVYGGDNQTCLQIIQDLIDNLDDLITPYRYYIRHDMVTIFSSSGVKKDRCVFLFSDIIIITSCKRRSGNLNKRTNSYILNSPLGKQYLESMKHKFIMKLQFEDVDITGSTLTKKLSVEKDHLDEDYNLITKINELSKNIVYPHQNLDESIKETMINISKLLNDPGTTSIGSGSGGGLSNSASGAALSDNEYKANQVLLTINTTDRVESMTLIFSSQDLKANWEKCFSETKKTFFESCSRKPATFINSIAIPRNRSGIQFTCASVRINSNNEPNDIWICSTDGQMGQVSLLNTIPEFSLSSCNTVCNSRISCVLCVPPMRLKRASLSIKNPHGLEQKLDDTRNKTKVGEVEPAQSVIDTDSSEEEGDSQSDDKDHLHRTNSTNIPSTNHQNDTKYSTMWMGNDDGVIYAFQFTDASIRTVARKNRTMKQLSSSILALMYMDNRVFVSLGNGELVVFSRTFSGTWNFDDFVTKTVSQNPITCMLAVAGKLWCANGNSIVILNPNSLTPEHNITIEGEKKLILATGGNTTWGVWVASSRNLDIRLYHATKYTVLTEINVRQCLTQKITHFDELIRLHKTSCLKITCLHVCKDTLWIGSSAGIILNVKIPLVNNTTTKLNTTLSYIALNHGHVGPVRFLTSIEIAKHNQTPSDNNKTATTAKTYVLAGGEGYEEFKTSLQCGTIQTNVNITSTSVGSSIASEMISLQSAGTNSINNNASNSLPSNGSSNTLAQYIGNYQNINIDDSSIGKDDLTNFVLLWEV